MSEITLCFHRVDEAIAVMREVAAWGRKQGFRLWPEEWLTREELITEDARPENFCIGVTPRGETACAFILQRKDSEYWPDAPQGEAVYLHKLCVRRAFAHRQMSAGIVEAVRDVCREEGIRFIRLDAALDERAVGKIYLDMGFRIVRTISYGNGRGMALYEMEAE